ncbi:hypothetical protein QQF64_014717, partial [Cirrhinus molitorella]
QNTLERSSRMRMTAPGSAVHTPTNTQLTHTAFARQVFPGTAKIDENTQQKAPSLIKISP